MNQDGFAVRLKLLVMLLHERFKKVEKAKLELRKTFWEELEKHDLTYMEAVLCLSDILQSIVKYGLRSERHPDEPDKKADEA